ncbi:MAG: hypothetical protein QG650_609 [Patescibacteria group bacterium]|nr:hypothetical protein [Patescibacteria group bacterium]
MRKDSEFYRLEILGSIRKIETYVDSMNIGQFYDDERTFDACCMQLQHIGECGTKLRLVDSDDFRDVPFILMTGLRNRISHDYAGIDEQIVWNTIQHSLPELKRTLQRKAS